MKLSLFKPADSQQVIELFTDVFSESEGESEGQIVGGLASSLIATTEPQDLIGCVAMDNDCIVGCIFFSRFIVPNAQTAFMLSPVAVSTGVQGTGIGQQLISYGLDHLRSLNVELAFTYGNPDYYSKTGFKQISERTVQAPFVLSRPEGWLAQSLSGDSVPEMQGATQCVEALSDQKHW